MEDNNQENLERIFDFLHRAGKLKSSFRYSEIKNGMQRKESSADHSWRLTLMVFVITSKLKLNIDTEKALKMALVHDLAEAITGDIDYILIAEGKISKEEKQKAEIEAIKKLRNSLGSETGEEVYNLWNEFGECSTKEAKFVNALDKMETLTHLVETGYKTYDKPEFIANYADKAVKNFPELTGMLKIIKQDLKEEFRKGNIPWKEEYDILN
jgi:putative hydrolase of HD superfamily